MTLSPKQRVASCSEETQISCPSQILRGVLAGSVWSRQPVTGPAFHWGHFVRTGMEITMISASCSRDKTNSTDLTQTCASISDAGLTLLLVTAMVLLLKF